MSSFRVGSDLSKRCKKCFQKRTSLKWQRLTYKSKTFYSSDPQKLSNAAISREGKFS
jgi:hypothetical protein